MSVIIRLQNLPWSANALDIRNYFRGLSIPEGGVHIVGGELGDAFIAFSTDEDARQAMMLDCGKIKEIQVKLLLSSRSEMHKVIETARQSVPILSLTAPAPAPAPAPVVPPVQTPVAPAITPFSAALGTNPLGFGIPGIGNPQEIPQPAVIEPPAPMVSPSANVSAEEDTNNETERKRSREKDRRRSRTRSRSRDRKDRKRDRRDRSRSRDRRRRDRSRSRDRRDRGDRKRDRKDRSRSRDRSPSRRSRDKRDKNTPRESQEKSNEGLFENAIAPPAPAIGNIMNPLPGQQSPMLNQMLPNGQMQQDVQPMYGDPSMADAFTKLQELGKKRNPNAFQGEQPMGNGNRFQGGRGGGNNFGRRERPSRFENNENPRDVCVAIRNAPNHTSYGDVRRFFPFMIDKHGIKMINDNMGRRTGNIYVRFCDPRSKQLAVQRRNNELKGVQVNIESLPDDVYEAAVDSFLPYREENDEEEPVLIITDNDNRTPRSVLKLADLPNFVKEHDIIKSFSEFSLLSITLNDCRATRTKIAFVQFVKPEDAKAAFEKKDKYMFGRRQPTITPLTVEEFEKEKNSEKVIEQPQIVEVEDTQPEPVVPRDPRQRRQFEDKSPKVTPQMPAGPQAGAPQFFAGPFVHQQNFPAGFVPPQFAGFQGPAAMDPRTAANWAAQPGFPAQMNQMPGQMPNQNAGRVEMDDEPLDCVLMKGLPREATDRTIVNFLSDTGAVPSRIHLMLDGNGLPSGDCFCEFRSPQEARMAATKHGSNLEGCRVTVDLVTKGVVEEALEGPKQAEPPVVGGGLLGSGPGGPGMAQFFEVPQGPHRGGYMGRGPYRGGRGGFDSNRGFESSRGFDRGGYRGGFDNSRGSFRGRGGYERGGRGGFERGGRGGRGFGGRGRGGFENGRGERDMRDDEQDPALEDFGAPGCVVSMENVPFRATIDDIMNFFSEFDLTQDDVIRRYNERGQPTGDARVAFRTPFDAQRAVKTRHMDTINDRRISLTIL